MAWFIRLTDKATGASMVAPLRGRYANRRDAESAASPFLKNPEKWGVEFLKERPRFTFTPSKAPLND